MAGRIGPLAAEIIQGEGRKFTAPIVLVHGLWSTHLVWRRFVGFLGHRGWTTYAVDLRGRGGEPTAESLRAHLDDLRAAVATLPAPPVVIGHDLGGLLALHLTQARAVVALAPLPPSPRATAALQKAGSLFERWRGDRLSPPRGSWRRDYPNEKSVREPAAIVRELLTQPWVPPALPADVPGLVVTGEQDRIVDEKTAAELAAAVGAELTICSGAGHTLLTDTGWEERVSTVHRWLIQKLGAPLLALYEEAMNPEE